MDTAAIDNREIVMIFPPLNTRLPLDNRACWAHLPEGTGETDIAMIPRQVDIRTATDPDATGVPDVPVETDRDAVETASPRNAP